MRVSTGIFGIAVLCLFLNVEVSQAADPVLARLSFRITPGKMSEFTQIYETDIAPAVQAYGLQPIEIQGYPSLSDSTYSVLFTCENLAEFVRIKRALEEDEAVQEKLLDLISFFGSDRFFMGRQIKLSIFSAPAVPGGVTVARPGVRSRVGPGTNHWQTYDVTHGLSGPMVRTILQDREGQLWFGTSNNGVSRYDGHTWVSFTVEHGLADNSIIRGLCDRNGHLWFGSLKGVSRYDGQSWTTYTQADGLLSNQAWPLFEDGEGRLYFGTSVGVSIYDGQNWVAYTADDGLSHNQVLDMCQDLRGRFWFATSGGVDVFDGQVWTSYTKKDGLADNRVTSVLQDRNGYMWFGTIDGVTKYDGQNWTSFSGAKELVSNRVSAMIEDRNGILWFACAGGVSRYDGTNWMTYTTEDGLVNDAILGVFQDREGFLWFGTQGGVSRLEDGFTTFTTEDGLSSNKIWSIYEDTDNALWFGTGGIYGLGAGVMRLGGDVWTSWGVEQGLGNTQVYATLQDRDGVFWFATQGGVFCYDGKTFTRFGEEHGLVEDLVFSIIQDRNGTFWFGTEEGVSRYDGASWRTFDAQDGLAQDNVYAIFQEPDGDLWFGTFGGVSRYDGATFTTFTTADGLAHNEVLSISRGQDGHLWFGTHGGISRYDGQRFVTFTEKDGLASQDVHAVVQGKRGNLWIGTDAGGVSQFDGQIFQTLTKEDGLASNVVMALGQDKDGAFWFGSNKGVTRFVPPESIAPSVYIDAVVADRRYEKTEEVSIFSRTGLIVFEFHSLSYKTRSDAMVYRYRLSGYEDAWRMTHERRVEYQDLSIGTFVFEVESVDRDLSYSAAPATTRLIIHPPYMLIALIGGLSIALVGFVIAARTSLKRRRERDQAQAELIQTQAQLVQEMDKELQTAHEMQVGLLPKSPPRLPDAVLSGLCLPANHVGGDYYNFLFLDDAQTLLGIVLADVSGKAMQAATVAMRLNEILRYESQNRTSTTGILKGVDASLRGQIPSDMFVTCGIGILDITKKTIQFASAASPPIYHFVANRGVVEAHTVPGFPLGMSLDLGTEEPFQTVEMNMQLGDVLVLVSDGVEDAQNGRDEFYEGERLSKVIEGVARKGVSAEALRDAIAADVKRFIGNTPQTDDLTIIVLRIDD
ncbi:MAG: SpoIIE family protein phosphatase [Candidatus Latescibacteria bacterium]|nr:SpoIIE family protein phosphatase [Candidatus Latescibacterota bacterium]